MELEEITQMMEELFLDIENLPADQQVAARKEAEEIKQLMEGIA